MDKNCSQHNTATSIYFPERWENEFQERPVIPRVDPPFTTFMRRRWGWLKGRPKEPELCCARPCIREVFRPLGIYAKFFGLFPAYDLSFVEKLNKKEVKWIHVLDYMYTATVCIFMTGGAAICVFNEPQVLSQMKNGLEITDYYVIVIVFYLAIVVGVWSLFVFPKSSGTLIRYLDHFAHVDKILQFDGRYAMVEHRFAKRLLCHLTFILLGSSVTWWMIFICDLEQDPTWRDYLMIPIVVIAVMTHVIPTAFFIFFLNSIRIRVLQFNDKVRNIVLPITPSCFACKNFTDYGKELDDKLIAIKSEQLAFDIEKLRILHGEVSDLVHETSCIFGAHIMRDIGSSIIGIIMYTYFIIFLRGDQGKFWPIYIILDVFSGMKIFTMCLFAHWIKEEASSLLKVLHKVSALRLSAECNVQVQMFIKKLDTSVVITAAGFFDVDRRLLTSIVGAISTYFVILIQFKLTDMSSEFALLRSQNCNITTDELLDTLSKGKG